MCAAPAGPSNALTELYSDVHRVEGCQWAQSIRYFRVARRVGDWYLGCGGGFCTPPRSWNGALEKRSRWRVQRLVFIGHCARVCSVARLLNQNSCLLYAYEVSVCLPKHRDLRETVSEAGSLTDHQ